MPSKISVHVSGYVEKTFDILERMQPSVIKVYDQPSEMNIDEIRRRCPGAVLIYRQYTNLNLHSSADEYFAEINNTFSKLRGRGIYWEGLNEPVPQSVEDAQKLNRWFVRYAEIMHAHGELVAGFSWSTGNPTPAKWDIIVPNVIEAAAACDIHAFHEYYSTWGHDGDWGRYRAFEAALPAYARKPVVITEAGLDDNGNNFTGGYRGKITFQEYIEILRAYDAVLMQDPYCLGATVFAWADWNWPSFELNPMIDLVADYVASVGGGAYIPRPFPKPDFEPQPTYTFTVTPSSILVGQSATLTWNVEGVREAYLDGEGVGPTGSRIVNPTETTTYTLHIVLRDETTVDLAATLTVNPAPVPTFSFSATPGTILAGQSATLKWDVEGVREVYLDGQPVTGHETRVVAPTETTTYTLHIVLLDGSTQDLTATVTVNPAPTFSFTATPDSIIAGQSATLTWNVTGARSVELQGQVVAASSSSVVTPAQTTTYVLHIVFWDNSTKDLSVTVNVAQPQFTFTVNPSSITSGGSATLAWNVTGASAVTLDGQSVALQGTQIVSPTQTTTYNLHIVLLDTTTQDLFATLTVTPPGPIVTRPPTVTLTPENIALLQTYPRPAQDNGRGLHFNIDLRDTTIVNTVAHLVSINARWTLIYAQDELQARRAAQACWNAGIMPVVRIGKKVDEPFDAIPYVNALKAVGAPPYVQIYNEPGDEREWKSGHTPPNWVPIFAQNWAFHATHVYDAGGYPGLQVLGKEELDAAIDAVKAMGRADIFQRTFFALHNYGANHPADYPYDPLNQHDHPGSTIFDDDVNVIVFLAFAKWMQDRIGFVVPIIGGEGGWQYGAQEDSRYPQINASLHAQFHAEMFDWFRTGVIGNGEALPDYLFSVTPWIEGGWGGDDWWGGPLGDKTQTIEAVRALPAFVRKFSWDVGTPPPPPPTYSFTATPSTIQVGTSTTLQWDVTSARNVYLDGQAVAPKSSKIVSPIQTTTYTLSIVFLNGTTRDLSVTVIVTGAPPPSGIDWDAALDPLRVKLVASTANQAWRVVKGKLLDETQSQGRHHVFFTVVNENDVPVPGVKCVIDWVGRDPRDDPAVVTTDAVGKASCPLWSTYEPQSQTGVYFVYLKGAASDQVDGLGLPNNRQVSFDFTFKWSTGGTTPPPPPPPSTVTLIATPSVVGFGQSALLQWSTTGARTVSLDNEIVPANGTKSVTPTQTTTYTLHVIFLDGTARDVATVVTVTGTPPPPTGLVWDPRLTDLGVNLVTNPANVWRLTEGKYQDETESGGTHHIYYKTLNVDGTPAVGVKLVIDWVGREPGDQPAVVTTNINGEANCPLWAVMHPELKDGPYFTFVKDAPSDTVRGMGLPAARHVNFLLTFRVQ